MLDPKLKAELDKIVPKLRSWQGRALRPYRMAELIMRMAPAPRVIVEIGVYGGGSLIPQAIALKALSSMMSPDFAEFASCATGTAASDWGGQIYGIDPYSLEVIGEGLSESDTPLYWWKDQDLKCIREECLDWVEELGLRKFVTMILAESSQCVGLFPKRNIDILQIDGSHNEASALYDVEQYAASVRDGGYVWMDDTHFPSIQAAVQRLEEFADIEEDYGTYRLYKVR